MSFSKTSVFFILSLFTLSCSACNLSRNDSELVFNYKCVPTNGGVSLRLGISQYNKMIEGVPRDSIDPQEAAYQAWTLGARLHLEERFDILGKEGYEMVGISMYDSLRESTWVCFKKRIE